MDSNSTYLLTRSLDNNSAEIKDLNRNLRKLQATMDEILTQMKSE